MGKFPKLDSPSPELREELRRTLREVMKATAKGFMSGGNEADTYDEIWEILGPHLEDPRHFLICIIGAFTGTVMAQAVASGEDPLKEIDLLHDMAALAAATRRRVRDDPQA